MRKRFLAAFLPLLIVLSLVLPAGVYGQPAEEAVDSEKAIRGVDVSVWQGEIDFARVKADGIQAVYIRAGEGTTLIDEYFERNYQQARAAGLKYGFYHYVTARSTAEARAQADFFANLIRNKPQDMRAAMDFENLSGLTAEESNQIARAYLEQLESRLGHKPAVYSDAYDAASIWRSNLTDYPLWVADYGVREPYSIGGWSSWSGFQYSDRGTVSGISGHVDLDLFRGAIFLTDDEQQAGKTIRKDYCKENDGGGEPSDDYFVYTVQPGDTLWGLSREYGTTIEELARINHIANPNLIYVGQKLLIPR